MPETIDLQIVQEMWSVARNEPLTLGSISPFGFVDRQRYQRYVGKVVLTFTLDADPRTRIWSYELGIKHANGEILEPEVVHYWLEAFFGRERFLAARRNPLMTGEANFTFPYKG